MDTCQVHGCDEQATTTRGGPYGAVRLCDEHAAVYDDDRR